MSDQPDVNEAAALARLLDESEIQKVLFRYAQALDEKDWTLLATCFLESAIGDYEMIGRLEGYAAIEGICRKALDPMSHTQHLIGNVLINVDQDEALSSCYFQAQHVRPDFPGGSMNIIAGRYEDQLVRTDAGWKIRERKLSVLWTSGNAAIHELDGNA